jgi:hypothetical protein
VLLGAVVVDPCGELGELGVGGLGGQRAGRAGRDAAGRVGQVAEQQRLTGRLGWNEDFVGVYPAGVDAPSDAIGITRDNIRARLAQKKTG